VYDPDRNYSRRKAAEALRPLISGYACSTAIQFLNFALHKVEEQGSMHVCILKKFQHGGLRDIFVLVRELFNLLLRKISVLWLCLCFVWRRDSQSVKESSWEESAQ
jgi:hypothetical protein